MTIFSKTSEVKVVEICATDRPLPKASSYKKIGKATAWSAIVLLLGYLLFDKMYFGRSVQIASNRLIISTVKQGTFEDYIPVRARVAPLKTVFLDSVQAGRVEEVYVEDGATVKAGQIVLRLSNSTLQLSVMNTESRVMEQLNRMRDQELRLDQNHFDNKRSLVDIEFNIRRLNRELDHQKILASKAYVSRSEYAEIIDTLTYYQEKKKITLDNQSSVERLMSAQMKYFKANAARMKKNLVFVRGSLDELQVRSPINGGLSGFAIEVGQSITQGERVGQVSASENLKFIAFIDEYYLSRVKLGQRASLRADNGQSFVGYELRINKIYPNVSNGQFQVDLKIVGKAPAELRRGQTILTKLMLDQGREALLIPNGQFLQDTGGKWIFIVDDTGSVAFKRNIHLGRRNKRFIEVIAGLESGQRIITSSYLAFKDMERLILTGNRKVERQQ